MKAQMVKTLLVTKNKNVVQRLNCVMEKADFSNDFNLQITHFELLNDWETINNQAVDLLIMTEEVESSEIFNFDFWTNIPTIFLVQKPFKTNNSTVVYFDLDWFNADNFDISTLKFIANEAITKAKLGKQLKQQEKTVKNYNTLTQELLFATAHHLQEPLTIIQRYSQLLRQRYEFSLDTIGHQFLEYITRETTHQNEQLERFLEYLQIETEGYFIETVNVNEVVKTAIQTIESEEEIDNHVFHVRYKDLPTVDFNRYYLLLLFSELISNAIKFRKLNHFVQIEIEAKAMPQYWLFEVKDNGEGFEMSDVPTVFELFKKLHNRLLYKGVGLGLPIAKKIVEHYGGKIWIETAVHRGTTVFFTVTKDGGRRTKDEGQPAPS